MTTFEIPTVSTERPRLRALQASDLYAFAAMQANPEVMRFLVAASTAEARNSRFRPVERLEDSDASDKSARARFYAGSHPVAAQRPTP